MNIILLTNNIGGLMGTSVEILEKVIYYHSNWLLFFCGVLTVVVGLYVYYLFCKYDGDTKFIILGTIITIIGVTLSVFSVDKDISLFNYKKPYSEYTIMVTDDTNLQYLIENYTFKEEIYHNIWRITERED